MRSRVGKRRGMTKRGKFVVVRVRDGERTGRRLGVMHRGEGFGWGSHWWS